MGILVGIFFFGVAITGLVALGLVFALSFKEAETMEKVSGFGEAAAARQAASRENIAR